MQSILTGLGSGARILTPATGTPLPRAAASSSFGRYSAKRSIRPLIRSCGPLCGMPCTTDETSTTVSPLSTPSLKSSKYKIFILLSGLLLSLDAVLLRDPAVKRNLGLDPALQLLGRGRRGQHAGLRQPLLDIRQFERTPQLAVELIDDRPRRLRRRRQPEPRHEHNARQG